MSQKSTKNVPLWMAHLPIPISLAPLTLQSFGGLGTRPLVSNARIIWLLLGLVGRAAPLKAL